MPEVSCVGPLRRARDHRRRQLEPYVIDVMFLLLGRRRRCRA
jgi:hypothetical protein